MSPFPQLLDRSRRHRAEHGCGGYPYDKGSLLHVVAAALAPSRIVEVGTAIGYTSVVLASAARAAAVDTIDRDADHAAIAGATFEEFGVADRCTVHVGDAAVVLPELAASAYDLAFFDGFAPTASVVGQLHERLRPDGLLVCANLSLGGDGEQALGDEARWATHSLGETALAVKR